MFIPFLVSKIESARVTTTEPGNSECIAVDSELMKQAGLIEFQKVNICDTKNNLRVETHITALEGSPGSVILRGSAAEKIAVGDRVTVTAYALLDERELNSRSAKILVLNTDNVVKKVINGRL